MIGNRYNFERIYGLCVCVNVFALTVQCSCSCSCDWKCLPFLFAVFVRSLKCWSHKCDFVSFDNGIGVTFFLLFRYKNFHWWYFIRIKRFVLSGVIAILILNLWLPLALLLLFFYSWRILCLYHSNDLFTFSGEFAWLSCIPFSFSPFSLFFLNFIFQAS